MFVKYFERVWQKNKCGGISCLYLVMFKKKKKKKKKKGKERKEEKEKLYTKQIFKFQFRGVVGGISRVVGELEFL